MTEPDVDLPVGYADAAPLYTAAGWAGVIPVPARTKEIDRQVVGYTGRNGAWPTRQRIELWREHNHDANLAVRLPRDVLGIDLDLYKNPEARQQLEARIGGPLPPTWCSTSRVDGSGIRLYRVPPPPKGKRWVAGVDGVDIIRYEHRYVVAWPSIHPLGAPYRWIDETSGEIGAGPPHYDDLTELPYHLIHQLLEDDPDYEQRDPIVFTLADGDPTDTVARYLHNGLDACTGSHGTRHDNVLRTVTALTRLGERGEPGVGEALERLRNAFVAAVAEDRPGGDRTAEQEYAAMRRSAQRAVATTQGRIPTRQERDAEHHADRDFLAGISRIGNHNGHTDPQDDPPPADKEPPTSRLQRSLYYGDEILSLPPVEWLIDGILQADGLTMIYGPPKSYKSFLAIDMALHVANGFPWRGLETQRTRAMYIGAEGAPGIGPRVRAWCQAYEGSIEGMVWLTVAPDLFVRSQARDEVDEVAQIAAANECGIVIVDTLARAMPGAEENSAKDMGVVVAHLNHIQLVANCNVTGVHHTGKEVGKGMRGSSALHGAIDTGLAVVGDRHVVNMTLVDQKNAESGQTWWWRPQSIHGSVVMDVATGADVPVSETLELNILKQLQLLDAGQGVSSSDWGAAVKERGHCSDTVFKERRKGLSDRGYAVNLGSGNRGCWKLTQAGSQWLETALEL